MANTVNIGDYQYTLYDKGKASAVVRDKTKSSYGNIPSTITVSGQTYNVTYLTSCFLWCSSLTTAPTIPSGVTDLYNCFYGCSSLTTAPAIPSSVKNMIGCFCGCSSLTTAPTIPSSVTNLSSCFEDCSSLTTAPTIPSSVTKLSYCFHNCSALTTAPTIPSSVTILSYCFQNCSALTTAPAIPSGVTDIYGCFSGCSSLTTAPTIPNSVTDMRYCFEDCSSLTTAPTIPNSVTNLNRCFYGCTKLTSAPTIPSSVTVMTNCFFGCRALTGNIIINANATQFDSLFVNTQKGIWLTGTSSKLNDYAATGNNNNVYVGEIPLSYRLTAERVAYDGQTEPVPEGLWAHVKLTIDWSNFTENSIDNITLKNGIVSINPTWYSDADKTNAITLPNWRPNSASTTIHCWINVTSATHVLSVTGADRYHTGVVITFTVPQQFRTVEFLAGGHGVAFGMPATQNGMFINMDLAIKEYSNIVKNIYDVFYPVGSYYETNLPSAIPSGQSTPTDADLENLGVTWFDPNFAWGGTWALESGGNFHIAAGNGYPVGTTGGEATHKLTTDEIPAHAHTVAVAYPFTAGGTKPFVPYAANSTEYGTGYSNVVKTSGGNGHAHNNIPPYIAVNRWHRTA